MQKYSRFLFQPCITLGPNGKRATASDEHIALSRKAAAEGMVLLKNTDGVLPLKGKSNIALFGSASYEYIKGGGGSGDVYCPYTRSLYEGLIKKQQEGKIKLFVPLCDFYLEFVKREKQWKNDNFDRLYARVCEIENGIEREIEYGRLMMKLQLNQPDLPENLICGAAEFADTAIMSISRYSGEAWDRSDDKGDFRLSDGEKALSEMLCKKFDKVVIVLNIGGVVETGWIKYNPKISAALISWQAGMEGGLATADIICGDVNPSGKLCDTFAASLSDYPSTEHFNDSYDYVEYNDDIYVGYRYFETIPGAKDKVCYPFGYGLSYTTFDIKATAVYSGDEICVSADVKNTGGVSGREVVQVYYSAPDGLLGKPARELAAFKKTKLLSAGEEQKITLSFKVSDMASFDDSGKISMSSYVLEKGIYRLFVGNSVENAAELSFVYVLDEDITVLKLQSRCAPAAEFKRLRSNGEYESVQLRKQEKIFRRRCSGNAAPPDALTPLDKVGNNVSIEEFIAQMDDDELIRLVGCAKCQSGVCNTGCFGNIPRLGIPPVPTADGPAGVRLEEKIGVATTALPCATLLACTFDTDLIYEVGRVGATELKENNLGVWLTPAMNIHRSPMCGRNFEYFSEDPYLTGKAAAALVNGIQSQNVAACVKHFAVNNKEINRANCDSRVSERALREIYLKGFEICIKDSDPWTLMSSYNLINGVHTSESYELLTDILREEWGFNGLVTTDWGVKNDPVAEVKAGNDIKMHIPYPGDLKSALDNGGLTRADLENCAEHILSVFLRFE